MSILVWLVILVLVVLHLVFHVGLSIALAAPDLITIALLIAARGLGMGGAATLGMLMGLLEDALSPLSFGANALALAFTGAVASRTRDLFVGDSLLFGVSYLLLGKWLRDFVHWMAVGLSFASRSSTRWSFDPGRPPSMLQSWVSRCSG